ncbi:hypothetical protein [Zavarzinia sp. CC-PAN008]|uniref:hypothetical protein n=1 Tax=Zavarzinia sp. CC-PAN008 TaxID=3243332 RepID=UPI003F74570F
MWWLNGTAGQMADAWFGMVRTGIAAAETMVAAGTVIGHRTALIADAMQRPWAADHRELGRMVPEKVMAFGQSGSNVMQALIQSQRELERYCGDVGACARDMAFAAPGSLPMARLIDGAMAQSARAATSGLAAVDAALAPIHKRAVANARRLTRKAG